MKNLAKQLTLNKTKIMTNITGNTKLTIGNTLIETVNDYKYLGQTVTFGNRTKTELEVRRAAAWKAFWAQKTCLKGKMKLRTKIKILESTVYPVLTYRAQTWACTAKQLQKILITQYAMLRNILSIRIKDKIKLSKSMQKPKLKTLWNRSKN